MTTTGLEQAFATPGFETQQDWGYAQAGLTKREYFAALALQGLCAEGGAHPEYTSIRAVMMADGLIAALNK